MTGLTRTHHHGDGIAVTLRSEESGPPYPGRANNSTLPWVITLPPTFPWEDCHCKSPPRWPWTLKLLDSNFCLSRHPFHFHMCFIEIACALACYGCELCFGLTQFSSLLKYCRVMIALENQKNRSSWRVEGSRVNIGE